MVLRPGRAALEEAQAEKVLSCPPLAQKPPLAQAPPKPVWPLTPSSFSASTLASVFPFRFILPCTPSPAPSQAREQPVPAEAPACLLGPWLLLPVPLEPCRPSLLLRTQPEGLAVQWGEI